jgi:hypothetical protein
VAAPVHGGSLVMEQWREERVGSPSRASPGHGRRCGNRAMAAKKWRWWRSVRMVLGHGKKRMTPGGFAVEDGGALPFYRGRGGLGQRSVDKVKEWPVLMGMKWLPLNWRGM